MQFSIKIDYFWRSKNSKRSMRVHNYFASRKSRVTNERNFSATPISSFSFSSFFCLFSSSLSQWLRLQCATNALPAETKSKGWGVRAGDFTFDYIYVHLRTVRTLYSTLHTRARIRSRARDTSTCGNKTATLIYLLV